MGEQKVKDRTAFICTAILAATMALCTWYLGVVIKVSADEISSDESDDSDEVQQTAAVSDPRAHLDAARWSEVGIANAAR
jgi:hypothetical protein